ncbi:iron-containing alcohol dehydrogenase [Amycolatopsis rhabdoformis]|uniref:Iron-containing alcohol dehydrogenase n=1 Tax=Amycolatopsis rhabdoformis TaxID=1448059 RepID=A0ABZ1IA49_9PSEU|nr:iron-containing alcohol dehydrogenase [Amycolatopsis rhabdoformis]WSE31349.1 iron-containing alcohol dehydrogenase [Amycolatopsis rhabdoformis]
MLRTEFGPGFVERLPEFVAELGGTRVFVVTDRGLRATGIVGRVEKIFATAGVEHEVHEDLGPNPATTEVDRGAARLRDYGAAVVIALGGGSALDAAKGISLLAGNPGSSAADAETLWSAADGLPIIAVPTTSGTGAETNGFGVVEDVCARRKVYLGHDSVRPRIAVLDPELTLGLPAPITAATGLDALVHGVESLASRGADAVSTEDAARAVTLVGEWLPVAYRDGRNLEARSHLMLGAHLAGHALTRSGLGLVHGLGHAITARTGTPHGVALAAVLDEVMTYTAPFAATAYARVAESLKASEAVAAVATISAVVDLKRPLRSFGLTRADLPEVATVALADAVTKNAPRTPAQAEIEDLLVSVY